MASRVVFIGDDFTGASDSLARYARDGWKARLLTDPRADEAADLDAVGLPTDLRALPPDAARAEIARLWPAIAALDPEYLHLKVCSTFDSGPDIGSIGAVASALADRFAPQVIAVVGGQPDLGRFCAFGNLFARGPDGAVHRIDRHPVMRQHPVTPMAEADLTRHLSAQGLMLDLVTWPELRETARLTDRLRAGPVLLDVMETADLDRVGAALAALPGRKLLIGSSSVARMLTGEREPAPPPAIAAPQGRGVLAFAGSRSSITAAQVAAAEGFIRIPVTPEALANRDTLINHAAAELQGGQHVLLHLDPDQDYGLPPADLADRGVSLVDAVLERADVGWLGVAGGDTSSRICAGLGFTALDYLHDIAPGVCLCAARHGDPRRDRMRVMLKGGQMGGADLFTRFASLPA